MHRFEAQIRERSRGRSRYSVVFLEPSLHALLPLDRHPRLRFEGSVEGIPISAAWQPSRGRWYALLSKRFLREAELEVGETVGVEFRVVPQDQVDVPRELEFALGLNRRARAAWDALTPGKRRGFAHRVASAKREETRERRVEEVIDTLLELCPGE